MSTSDYDFQPEVSPWDRLVRLALQNRREPGESGVDRRVWPAAILVLAAWILLTLAGDIAHVSSAGLTGTKLFPISDVTWSFVAWLAAGLVATLLVGRSWGGVWVVYLLWGVQLTINAAVGVLRPLLADRALLEFLNAETSPRAVALGDVLGLILGLVLLWAAWRQSMAWRQAQPPAAAPADRGRLRLIVVLWIALLVAEAVAAASLGRVARTETWLISATIVAMVAYQAAWLPRMVAPVLAVGGLVVAASAISEIAGLVQSWHDLAGISTLAIGATVVATVIELGFGATALLAAAAMRRLPDDEEAQGGDRAGRTTGAASPERSPL